MNSTHRKSLSANKLISYINGLYIIEISCQTNYLNCKNLQMKISTPICSYTKHYFERSYFNIVVVVQ